MKSYVLRMKSVVLRMLTGSERQDHGEYELLGISHSKLMV